MTAGVTPPATADDAAGRSGHPSHRLSGLVPKQEGRLRAARRDQLRWPAGGMVTPGPALARTRRRRPAEPGPAAPGHAQRPEPLSDSDSEIFKLSLTHRVKFKRTETVNLASALYTSEISALQSWAHPSSRNSEGLAKLNREQ